MSVDCERERMVTSLPGYNAFTASPPVIPQMYYDVYSNEQRVKQLCCNMKKIIEYANATSDQVNINTDDIAQMQEVIDSIENGEYFDKYIDGLGKWIDENLTAFVARIAQYVFPGFYWDGDCWRYQVVVPADWNWLRFEYIWCEDGTFHMVLKY